MSHTQTLYHIVIRTYRSERTIPIEHERDLYAYMVGLSNNLEAKIYRIGGMPEHIHILVSLPPDLSMSKYVQLVKISTNKWIRASHNYPHFRGWSKEYAGFTYGMHDKDMIVNYIKNQKEHHRRKTFAEELREILEANGIKINDKYFLVD